MNVQTTHMWKTVINISHDYGPAQWLNYSLCKLFQLYGGSLNQAWNVGEIFASQKIKKDRNAFLLNWTQKSMRKDSLNKKEKQA